jgi:O-antigen ligase
MLGFNTPTETAYSENEVDIATLTADRDTIWNLALEQFKKAPLIGYGRLAMQRTGASRSFMDEFGSPIGHAHCAYIEQLIDNGIVGLLIVLLFYSTLTRKSFSLLQDKKTPLHVAVGGVALALVLAQLITSLTSQSFYPRQGVVGMWCAIGLMLRVYVEKEKARQTGAPIAIWK